MGVRVSVVTAVRNGVATIADCLESVSHQKYQNRQHIVVDGLSTDGTAEVIERYRSAIDGLICERDSGIYNALNKGVRACSGDVIGFLHADDVFSSPDVLTEVARRFENPKVSIVYGDALYVKKGNVSDIVRYWRAGEYSRARLAWGWMPPHPTMYLRRELYTRFGGFDESYRIASDYDSILKIFSLQSLGVEYVPNVLVKMRVGGVSNASLGNIFQKSAEDLRALRSNRVGGVGTLIAKNLRKVHQFRSRPRVASS